MEVITTGWGYAWRWIVWFTIPIACILLRGYYLQYTNFMSLYDSESVVVSPAITVHTLSNKGEIKTVSVPARLPRSLVHWCSLNWLNSWDREIILDVDQWDGYTQKYGGEKLLWLMEGNISGDWKDDFVNK